MNTVFFVFNYVYVIRVRLFTLSVLLFADDDYGGFFFFSWV